MMDTIEVLQEILLRNPDIKVVRVVCHDAQKDMKQDMIHVWSPKDEKIYQKALELRKNLHIPFWNSIMISSINNPHFSEIALCSSLHHNPIHKITDINVEDISQINTITAEGDRKSINSRVTMIDGSVCHLPMLDFHINGNPTNTKIVKTICGLLGVSGYLLYSGKSYHFIGEKPFGKDAMITFLAKALLFTPIVDEIWISHQLQEGSCSLRFGKKHNVVPTLICRINLEEINDNH